jgi:NADH-quinone oxidoreductase subunit E
MAEETELSRQPVSEDGHGALIARLEGIQARYSYLPENELRTVAEETGWSLVDIYGVATFYKAFSLVPRGRHLISACLGTACHVRGGQAVAAEIQRLLGAKAGGTTADREFTFETVNCLGACALGPVVVVDGRYFPHVTTSAVAGILERARTGLDIVEVDTDQRVFPIDVSCARCNHSLMDPKREIDGFPSIQVTVSHGDKHGWMALSSLWGSYIVLSLHEVSADTIVHMFCPHCHSEMIGGGTCVDCGAPMVPMIVRGGGIVQLCSRRGCRGHLLDLRGTSVD